ncbi:MAG: AAA family ATPase [Candidatus Thorarchaeota archaeon]|nr:MAG: AAA family ATPase [Candidatus Thorarchaeota archaeon]
MNILLTGPPSIGKSTVIKKIVNTLAPDRAEGFWTGEIRRGTERVGFSITTLDGQTGLLAHRDLGSGPQVGKYFVNLADIDRLIVPVLRRARQSAKMIVIDEIASMELKSSLFAPEVRECLDTGQVLGAIQKKGGSFVEEVKSRPDVTVMELTVSNRDCMPQQVLHLLNLR